MANEVNHAEMPIKTQMNHKKMTKNLRLFFLFSCSVYRQQASLVTSHFTIGFSPRVWWCLMILTHQPTLKPQPLKRISIMLPESYIQRQTLPAFTFNILPQNQWAKKHMVTSQITIEIILPIAFPLHTMDCRFLGLQIAFLTALCLIAKPLLHILISLLLPFISGTIFESVRIG